MTVTGSAVRMGIGLALAWAAAADARAIAPVTLETHAVVRIEAITVSQGQSSATGANGRTEVGPAQPGEIALKVPWGAGGDAVAVRVSVKLVSVSPDSVVLRCESTASRGGSPPVRASRELALGEEGDGLFEVFGADDRRLLLTLHAERVERPVVGGPINPGDPVRFDIAVEGVAGDKNAVLETNEIRSFVGQSVEYSFRLGPQDGRQSIRLVLLPVSIQGDLITLQVDVSGVLPGPDGPSLISRSDRIVASRRATTSVAATVGTPPSGYRFQVTPDF